MGCDYASAVLDLCRFFNVDARSIKFPGWPCFTIVDHQGAAQDFLKGGLSSEAKQYAMGTIADVEEGEVALCLFAPREAKRLKCTETKLKEFLVGKPYVIL